MTSSAASELRSKLKEETARTRQLAAEVEKLSALSAVAAKQATRSLRLKSISQSDREGLNSFFQISCGENDTAVSADQVQAAAQRINYAPISTLNQAKEFLGGIKHATAAGGDNDDASCAVDDLLLWYAALELYPSAQAVAFRHAIRTSAAEKELADFVPAYCPKPWDPIVRSHTEVTIGDVSNNDEVGSHPTVLLTVLASSQQTLASACSEAVASITAEGGDENGAEEEGGEEITLEPLAVRISLGQIAALVTIVLSIRDASAAAAFVELLQGATTEFNAQPETPVDIKAYCTQETVVIHVFVRNPPGSDEKEDVDPIARALRGAGITGSDGNGTSIDCFRSVLVGLELQVNGGLQEILHPTSSQPLLKLLDAVRIVLDAETSLKSREVLRALIIKNLFSQSRPDANELVPAFRQQWGSRILQSATVKAALRSPYSVVCDAVASMASYPAAMQRSLQSVGTAQGVDATEASLKLKYGLESSLGTKIHSSLRDVLVGVAPSVISEEVQQHIIDANVCCVKVVFPLAGNGHRAATAFIDTARAADPFGLPLIHKNASETSVSAFLVPTSTASLFSTAPVFDACVLFLASSELEQREEEEARSLLLLLEIQRRGDVQPTPMLVVAGSEEVAARFSSALTALTDVVTENSDDDDDDEKDELVADRRARVAIIKIVAGAELEERPYAALANVMQGRTAFSASESENMFPQNDDDDGSSGAMSGIAFPLLVAMQQAMQSIRSVDVVTNLVDAAIEFKQFDVATILPASKEQWDGMLAEAAVSRFYKQLADDGFASSDAIGGPDFHVLQKLVEEYEAIFAGPRRGKGEEGEDEDESDSDASVESEASAPSSAEAVEQTEVTEFADGKSSEGSSRSQ